MENTEMNQLLGAIGQMMDEKLEPIKQDISSINQRLTSVEEKIGTVETRMTKMELTLENDVKKSVQLLAEGHTEVVTRLDRLEEKTDDIQETASILKVVTKSLHTTGK